MARLWRVRRVMTWAAMLSCCVLIVAALESFRGRRGITSDSMRCRLTLHDGLMAFIRWNVFDPPLGGGLFMPPQFMAAGRFPESTRWPVFHHSWWGFELIVPAWLVIGIAAITAVGLWRVRQPTSPGHCPCGYDLTGNVSGRCPECGTPVPAGNGTDRGVVE